MSWRHYCYGLRYLGRAHLRELRTRAEAHRIGAATEESYKTASRELRLMLEIPRRSRG